MKTRSIIMAVAGIFLFAAGLSARPFRIQEVGSQIFDTNVELLVRDIQNSGIVFSLDIYQLQNEDLTTTPLNIEDATALIAQLDLHVSVQRVNEVGIRPLYDELLDLVREYSPNPSDSMRNVHTLGSLLSGASAVPSPWQLFVVHIPTGLTPVDMYFGVNRSTGRLVVLEMQSGIRRG